MWNKVIDDWKTPVEYIDREAAFDAITDIAGKTSTHSAYEAVWKSARTLKKIPTADVVPVVRCKDCKYAQNDYDGFSTTVGCNMLKCAMGWHSFCSYGKRKDGGADNG